MSTKSYFYKTYKNLIKTIDYNLKTGAPLKNEYYGLPKKWNEKGSTKKYWEKELNKLNKMIKKQQKVKQPKKYNGFIYVHISYQISKDPRTRIVRVKVNNVTEKQIKAIVNSKLNKKFGSLIDSAEFKIIGSAIPNKYLDVREMILNDVKFFKVNIPIKANEDIINYNCVHHALLTTYPEYYKKAIKEAQTINNWTVETFINFLEKHKINHKLYYKNMVLYKEGSYNKRKTLYGLLKNEHIYLLQKTEISTFIDLNKNNVDIDNIKYQEDLKPLLINAEEYPIEEFSVMKTINKIKEVEFKFKTLTFNKTYYTTDKLTYDAFNLYTKFIDVILTPGFKSYTPVFNIIKRYKSSYINFLDQPQPILYDTGEEPDFCIDKNRAYLSALVDLPYIPVISPTSTLTIYTSETEPEYFYKITKIINNPYNQYRIGWCSGYRITDFKDIEISHFISPTLYENPLSNLFRSMDIENPKVTKKIAQIFTGVLQCKKEPGKFYNEIMKTPHGYDTYEYDKVDGLYCGYKLYDSDLKFKNSAYLPIAHYIIDYNIKTLINKATSLKCKITRIKTDSIAGLGDVPTIDESNKLNGWKYESIGYVNKRLNIIPHKKDKDYKEYNYIPLDKSILLDCGAGAGKTTFIIEKLLKKLPLDETLIISSTHNALQEYYKDSKLNVATIQHFVCNNNKFNHEFKKYKYIIIDEIGLLDDISYNYLYDNLKSDTIIYGAGDRNQLEPYGLLYQPLNNDILKYQLFDGYIKLDNNWRNNFSKEDYKNMQNNTYNIPSFLEPLINKITNNNICVKNDTREKLNSIITKKYKETFGLRRVLLSGHKLSYKPFKIKKGCKIVSVTNNLKKLDIYNNTFFNIVDFTEDNITLNHISNNKIYKLTEEEFNKNFDYGYSHTITRCQGQSIEKDDISFHDMSIIKKSGKALYTALSRIKEKLINKPIDYNISIGDTKIKTKNETPGKIILDW